MMRALYSEDEAACAADQSRFPLNIAFLIAQPSRGRIVLFSEAGLLRGYALLIPYWSNEFGGTLLYVDEMLVIPEARNRGIGRSFCELSGAVRKSETVTLRHTVVPVADGFLSGFVRVYGLELRKRNGHLPRLPADLHQHVVLAGILCGHT